MGIIGAGGCTTLQIEKTKSFVGKTKNVQIVIMERSRWLLNVRNKLANFAGECDSDAAIVDSDMTLVERAELQHQLRMVYHWIDKELGL